MTAHRMDTVSRHCRHKETETETVTRDGDETGTETSRKTKTFTKTVKFANEGVPSSSARGLGGKKGRKPSKAAPYGLKATSNDCRSYEWPESLYPLREWLHKHGVDVGALKSERQALWLAKRLGRQGKKMPHRLAPLFPALLKIQRTLCPEKLGNSTFRAPISYEKERGTFGPASSVRSVSIAAYIAEKEAVEKFQ